MDENEKERESINKDVFRELAQALLPHLSVITEELHEHLDDATLPSICVCGDGYISLEIRQNDEEWRMYRVNREDRPVIDHTCRDAFYIDDEEELSSKEMAE